jgi:hypothetical protein
MNGKHLFHYKSCEDNPRALHVTPRSRENLNKMNSYENRQKEAAKRLSQDQLNEIKKNPELFQKLLDKAMRIEKEKTSAFTYELSFSINYETLFGERVVITGQPDFLGNWDPLKGLELEWTEGGTWKAKVLVGEGSMKDFEYKYVCIKKHEIRWENGNNRIFNIKEGIKQNSLILFNKVDLWQVN